MSSRATTASSNSPPLSAPPFLRAAAPWALALGFIALSAFNLDVLLPNVDEGVYILQSRLVRQGDVPYVDFFYHQTPLYLYILSGVSHLGGDSITLYRSLSLIATALSGVVLFWAGSRLDDFATGVLVQLAFYAAPLQVYGMLALPNAVMMLLTTAGFVAVVFRESARWVVAGGVLLVAALLVKPLTLPAILALVVALALFRDERRKLPALAAAGILTGLFAWLLLHVVTEGGFTEVLALQALRFSGRSGFELMSHYSGFRAQMLLRGATTPTLWNLSEHLSGFLRGGLLNGNLLLILVASAAPFCWKRGRPRRLLVTLVLWLLASVWFCLFVWEPIWDHYFVQYLPPLALLAGVTQRAALRLRGPLLRGLGVVLVIACTTLGYSQQHKDPLWYSKADWVGKRVHGSEVFSFNPLIHVVNGTRPACGLIDPLNVFGEHSIAALAPDNSLIRFRLTAEDLVACLDSEVPVVIDEYAFWFLEPPLLAHFESTRERLVFFDPRASRRFEALAVSDP